MNYYFRSVWFTGKLRSGPDKGLHKRNEEAALNLDAAISKCNAELVQGAKGAQVHRADADGVNAGKFFLHLILK